MENQTLILQSRQIATNTLKNHSRKLYAHEVAMLNKFLQQTFKAGCWKKITERQCIKIIDIARNANQRIPKIREKRTRTLPV